MYFIHSQLLTMSHHNQPEYYTLVSICSFDGTPTVIGIFEDIDAVMYRLKRCHTSCGDEYRIECFHLSTAEKEAKEYNDLLVSRRKHQQEQQMLEEIYTADEEKEEVKVS